MEDLCTRHSSYQTAPQSGTLKEAVQCLILFAVRARLQSTHAVRCVLHESISKGHRCCAGAFLSAGLGISPFSNSDLHLAHARLLPLQDAIAKGHSYVVLTCTPPRPRRLLARAHSWEMAAASLPARSRAGVIVSLTPFFFMMILKVSVSNL